MSSILNVLRSAPTSTRAFTSINIAPVSSSAKTAFHPEHHPIVLQQLVQSLTPAAGSSLTSVAASSARQSASSSARKSASSAFRA
ncbi:hypothetical protein BGX28_007787 [Mortierella sp. GBA30]|nr:hypothetical protein BGX28_007787 [Mortierella sp. GBA30]